MSAQRLLNEPGYHPVFFDDDGGREALFAYIVAAVFRVLGASIITLRGTAAALGVLGVIAIWIAARRFGRGAALTAMAWSAGSLWLIAVSRDGFRDVITIAAGGFALAALLRWGDRASRGTALIAGGVVGVAGFWTYQPLKLLPLLAVLWLLWLRRTDRERYRAMRGTLGWAAAALVAVTAPIIWTAITDASSYFGRALTVSAFNPKLGPPESFPVHVVRTLGMFLFTGDANARHDAYALPMLGPVLFVLFALGIWRAWRRRADHRHALILLGLIVFLAAPVLAPEGESPHFLRSLGLAPYVAVCVGLGCAQLALLARRGGWRTSASLTSVATPLAWAACSVAIVAVGLASAVTYLNRPAGSLYSAYSYADVALATAAAGGPATVVIINDYDGFDVRFLDAGTPPTIIAPTLHIANPAVYSKIVATSRADIAAATDPATAMAAQAVAFDLQGRPVVFEVTPQPGVSP